MKSCSFILACLLCAIPVLGDTVSVKGTIEYADGTAATGYLRITWPTFTTAEGEIIGAAYKEVTIGTSGAFSTTLQACDTAEESGISYTVRYYLDDGTTQLEYWIVTDSPDPNDIKDIRTTSQTTPTLTIQPSQISGSGASSADHLMFNGSSWAPTDYELTVTDSAIDVASMNDGACSATETVTLTGAALGDFVSVVALTDVLAEAVYIFARVTSANTVKYFLCNLSGAAEDPASTDFRIQILKSN